ncbi:MAG TPA: phenylalanine--tRNA ligase subunit beta, partial [Polyangiales bacterium]
LHTDSSHRFERGVDPEAVRPVLAYAASLIAQLSGGVVLPEALDLHPQPIPARRVTYRPSRAVALLGLEAAAAELATHAQRARAVFERLGCSVQAAGENLAVTLPTFRPDLGREVDLIEEFARTTGYDTIPTALPHLRVSAIGNAPEIGFVRRLREVGAAVGLCEGVNFAFVAPSDLDKARVSLDAPRLANPMTEERSVLRTALLPGMLANLRNAQRHAQRSFGVFEVARVFSRVPSGLPSGWSSASDNAALLPSERYELGVLLWGLRQSWYEERESLDFYDGKGVVTSFLQAAVGQAPETVLDAALDQSAAYLHPKRRASLRIAGQSVGCLGELHPDVLSAFELEGRPVYAVLDVAALLAVAAASGVRKVQALPRFPASTRDLAVVVAESLPAGDVAAVLHEVVGQLAESVRLFDIYRGAPVPAGHKSLAFHVVYRDPTSTLTDKLVDEAHARATLAAQERFGASVRK